jgi:hypothetical protein
LIALARRSGLRHILDDMPGTYREVYERWRRAPEASWADAAEAVHVVRGTVKKIADGAAYITTTP